MKMKQIEPIFVDEIPDNPKEGVLYVCLSCNSMIHRCACGCGEIVSTPLDRKYGWIMNYDGEQISLQPSIGNGAYACRSHYFIKNNRIIWLDKMQNQQMEKTKCKTGKKIFNHIKMIYMKIKRFLT